MAPESQQPAEALLSRQETRPKGLHIVLLAAALGIGLLLSKNAGAQIEETLPPATSTNPAPAPNSPNTTQGHSQDSSQGGEPNPQGKDLSVQSGDSGQSSDSSVQGEPGQFVFRKQVEEVVLHATVVDQQNNLVPNLGSNGFQVYEDGKLQQITSFHQERVPVALGILIDNSGSMLPKRAAVNHAALNLIHSTNPQDEIFVVNFGEEYYLDQDFTNDESKLKAALEHIETRGSTALYDAVVASASHMKQETTLQKRALLVVTDGGDNASQETLEEAVQELQKKDSPVVYVIALTSPSKRLTSALRALEALSLKTGGSAYFPTDVQEVDSITRKIASAIRSQYVIGYKSSSTASGHVFHGIDVQAYDPTRRKLRVQTRNGYYSDSKGGTS
jgi:Ca-activated chloride channel family protein